MLDKYNKELDPSDTSGLKIKKKLLKPNPMFWWEGKWKGSIIIGLFKEIIIGLEYKDIGSN